MKFTPASHIQVGLNFGRGRDTETVGRLAIREGDIYFEYDSRFLAMGLNLSPIHLPLKVGVQIFNRDSFEGLPGLFDDSLPDGWGRMLFDRTLRAQGILPKQVTPLDRLALTGKSGMGALTYEPDHSGQVGNDEIDLDWLATQSAEVLEGASELVLAELLTLNGSSAGARPKALIGFDLERARVMHGAADMPDVFEPWLVKFSNTQDGSDAGAIEYVYAEMARRAGLEISMTHLFAANKSAGYFGTKRFDRVDREHLHMHTACGLLHSDYRTPALDYEDLIELTSLLTRDVRETHKMFRIAVFNVLAHNRDDHSKNFSFLMNEVGEWRLSPAYDLTFSSGPGGDQSTMVMGEGKAPGLQQLRALGKAADMNTDSINHIIEQTQAALNEWPVLAKDHGVKKANIDLIGKRISRTSV